jgi:glutamate N-acetyltransferase / amino-acid N-acetyltransferase
MSNRRIDGGVTAPSGFRASGLHCGIKASGKPDLSLIVSDVPASAAGVFTTNLAKAAPIYLCQDHLASSRGHAMAIITNSGCANACTGPQGEADATEMAQLAAAALGCDPTVVLVASTGVIGVNLKMDKIRAGVPKAVAALDANGGAAAARAIMTTDPFPKEYAVEVATPSGAFRVGGMAKGSGMIEPRMATMLGYLTTDAAVDPAMLSRALTEASRYTFNAITVDGEPSTNDCVFALANGASGVEIDEPRYPDLIEGLRAVAHELALGVVRGGEGATKLIAITVTGAESDADAWMAARAIANSPLVKTAVAGEDANWGRVVMAVGKAGEPADRDRLSIWFGDNRLAHEGERDPAYSEEATSAYMKRDDIRIRADIGIGRGKATVWTCDLTKEYVAINGDYRS